MEMCARCHKRMAVVFITRLENGESKNEGICLKCAKELGIKPIDDILKKTGTSNEDFDRMTEDAEEFMQGMIPAEDGEEPSVDGGAPAIDFNKVLRDSGLGGEDAKQNGAKNRKEQPKNQKSITKELFSFLYARARLCLMNALVFHSKNSFREYRWMIRIGIILAQTSFP